MLSVLLSFPCLFQHSRNASIYRNGSSVDREPANVGPVGDATKTHLFPAHPPIFVIVVAVVHFQLLIFGYVSRGPLTSHLPNPTSATCAEDSFVPEQPSQLHSSLPSLIALPIIKFFFFCSCSCLSRCFALLIRHLNEVYDLFEYMLGKSQEQILFRIANCFRFRNSLWKHVHPS